MVIVMRKIFYIFYTVIGILVSEFYPESWGASWAGGYFALFSGFLVVILLYSVDYFILDFCQKKRDS